MDEQQSRLLTWMAGALVLLIAALVFIDPPDDTEDDEEWTPLHSELTTDKVDSMRFSSAEGSITVARDGDRWTITAPDPRPADQDRATEIARAIAGIQCGAPVADAVEPQYGLAPPLLSADITLKGGAEVQLSVGKDAPVGWSSYAVCGGDGAVRTTQNKLDALRFSLDDLKSHAILPGSLLPSAVIIERETGGGEREQARLTLREDGWYLGDGRRASPDAVRQLLDQLSALKAAQLDAPPLDEISTSLVIETDGQDKIVIEESRSGSIRTPEQPTPVRLAQPLAEILPDATAMLADTLFTLDAPQTITIAKEGEVYTAQNQEDGWDQPWAAQLLGARAARSAKQDGDSADDAVVTVTASSPIAGEQVVQVLLASEQLWFRDSEDAPWAPLPDEVGKIIQSL